MYIIEELKKENVQTILVVTIPAKIQSEITSATKALLEKSTAGLFVTINKPYAAMKKALDNKGIDTSKIFFIDCVTAEIKEVKREEGVLYARGPRDLTGIGISISSFAHSVPGRKFLVIDSLKTFALYNDIDVIEHFISSIAEKAKKFGLKTIVFTSPHKDLVNKVSNYFDKVMRGGK